MLHAVIDRIPQGHRMRFHPPSRALQPDDLKLKLLCCPPDHSLMHAAVLFQEFRGDEIVHRATSHLLEGIGFDEAEPGLVHLQDCAVVGHTMDTFWFSIKNRAKEGFLCHQAQQGLFVLGDIRL